MVPVGPGDDAEGRFGPLAVAPRVNTELWTGWCSRTRQCLSAKEGEPVPHGDCVVPVASFAPASRSRVVPVRCEGAIPPLIGADSYFGLSAGNTHDCLPTAMTPPANAQAPPPPLARRGN
jgi:hypothetical protein